MSKKLSFNQSSEFPEALKALQEERYIYQLLLQTLQEKQRAIVEAKTEELLDILVVVQSLAKKANQVTERRIDRFRKSFATPHDVSGKNPEAQFHIPDPEIRREYQELIQTVQAIERVNRENRSLLQASMEFTRGFIQVVYGANDNEMAIYDRHGKLKNKVGSSRTINW